MSQATLLREPPERVADAPPNAHEPEPREPHLVLGRPLEDRSFEVVEAGVGISLGMAIGTAVAGPIGTAVGGLVGAAAGIVAAEALERAAGRAAMTTDATDDEQEAPSHA
jgi:hypothetical protein